MDTPLNGYDAPPGSKDDRGISSTNTKHSPFAAALMEGLKGEADISPKPAGDGIITARELYEYLLDTVETHTIATAVRQTPQFWLLRKHNKGEFIFRLPGHTRNLPPAPPLDKSKNPYRGLQSFDEKHKALFFGRKDLIDDLSTFVGSHTLTVVMGSSGSGKSSLVKAGLIPYLKNLPQGNPNQQWQILDPFRPGESPLKALNNTIAKVNLAGGFINGFAQWTQQNPDTKMLLVIDQFEELITLCKDEKERETLLSLLAEATEKYPSQLRLVLTLRSDFEPQFRDTASKAWNKTWNTSRFKVPPMTRSNLREAIEKPADARVMYFEPHELVEHLIDEVADEPGPLPLLSFALSELYLKYLKRQWEAKNAGDTIDRTLTQADYQELGGVINSLTQRADEEYETLVQKNQAYAQIICHVMLRMVAISGGEVARRQVPLSELEYPPEKNDLVKEVIKRFTDARLLVTGEDAEGKSYVEPAHDALITGWRKIKFWLDEKQEIVKQGNGWNPIKKLLTTIKVPLFSVPKKNNNKSNRPKTEKQLKVNLPLQREVTTSANNWHSQKGTEGRAKAVGFLWNADPRLDLLEQALNSEDNWLNKVEAEFVQRSIGRKDFNTKMRWSIAIAVMVGLGCLAVWALINQRNTLIEQVRSSRQSAEGNLQTNNDLEALTDILRAKKVSDHWLTHILPKQEFDIGIPNTPLQVKWENSDVERTRVRGTLYKAIYATKERNRFQLDRAVIFAVAFNPKIDLLAIAGTRGTIRLYNSAGKQVGTFPADHDVDVSTLAFTPDGKWLATGGGEKIKLWKVDQKEKKIDTSTRGEEGKAKNGVVDAKNGVIHIAFNPNNNQVATITNDFRVQLWSFNMPKNEELEPNLVPIIMKPESEDQQAKQNYHQVAFRPSKDEKSPQNQLVTVNDSDQVTLWNTANNQLVEVTTQTTGQDNVQSIAFTQDGKLATGGVDKTIKFWEIKKQESGQTAINEQTNLKIEGDALPENIYGISLNAKDQLAIFGEDDQVTLLGMRGNTLRSIQPQDTYVNDAIAGNMAYSPDGKQVAVITGGRTIRLWNLESGKQEFRFSIPTGKYGNAISLAFSPSGKEFAVGTKNGYITLFNTSGEFLDKVLPQWNVSADVLEQDSSGQPNSKSTQPSIQRIIFSPDGTKLAVFSASGDLRILSLQNQNQEFKPNDFNQNTKVLGSIKDVVFDSKFNKIISIKTEQNPNVENVEFREDQSASPQKVKTQANSVAFSPDNSFFATAGEDGKVKLWKFDDLNKPYLEFDTHQKKIQSIAFNPKNSNILLTGGEDGTVQLWNISSEQPTSLPVKGQKPSLAISSDGNLLATLNNEGELLMWEKTNRGFQTKNISDRILKARKYNYISFMPNSDRLLTVDTYSDDKYSNVQLWDGKNNNFVPIPVEPGQKISWVDWSKDGKVLAFFGEKSFTLWHFQEGKFQEHVFQKHVKESLDFTSIDLSPDGSQLAMTQSAPIGRIKFLDTKRNDNKSEFQTQQGEINSVQFSSHEDRRVTRLVTIGGKKNKKTLRLWDISGNPLGLIQEDKINRARFSPDGKLLVGVSDEGSQLKVWDISGDKFNLLYGQKLDQKFAVKAFTFDDNNQLVILGNDGKVSLWQIGEQQLFEQACGLVVSYSIFKRDVNATDIKTRTSKGLAGTLSMTHL
ncbi:MAG: hypothetical protein ACK5CA_04410 [Cyanobacteriota bacterium]